MPVRGRYRHVVDSFRGDNRIRAGLERDLHIVADGGAYSPQFVRSDLNSRVYCSGTIASHQTGIGFLGAATPTYVSFKNQNDTLSAGIEIPANSDWSCQFVVANVGGTGTNPGFFRNTAGSGTTFFIQNGSNRRPWVRVSGSNVLQPSTGPQWTTGQTLNILVRFKNASAVDCWWDGKQQHSATHAVSQGNATGTDGVSQLLVQSSTEITTGVMSAFRFWRRYLTDGETQELAANEMWLYEDDAFFVPAPAAASGVPTLSSIGASSITSSSAVLTIN